MHDWVNRRSTGVIGGYATPVVTVVAAAGLTALLRDALHYTVTPLFIIAIAVSTLLSGLRGGLLAIALSLPAVVVVGLLAEVGLRHELWTGGVLLVVLLASAEAARQHSLQVLVERDMRLRLVTEQIPAALWSTNDHLRLSSRFGGAATLFKGAIGTSLTEFFPGKTDDYPPIASHLRALQGESSSFELEWEGRVFQAHVEPLQNVAGEIIGVIGVALDISDRKADEQRLELAKAEAEQATRARDRFLAILSHELRTPLTPAVMTVASLAGRTDLPAGVREDLELARRNIELEARLIDDLLDLTRVSTGKLELELRPADVHTVLREAVGVCRGDAEARQVELSLDLSATHHHARADAARLQQVFWNLLKNAIKFTPPGGRVSVRTLNEGAGAAGAEALVVEVADTGIGIEPHVLPRVFDAFDQGDSSTTRTFGGLGLGLAISRALVDAHGGRLTAASEGPGRGARFRMELQSFAAELAPALPAPSPSRPAPELAPAAAAPSTGPEAALRRSNDGSPSGRRKLRLLLVEDHADTRYVLTRLLRSAGHEVTTADTVASAREAMAGAAGQAIDLLLSDLALPDGTGLDVVRALHEGGPQRRVKAVALSGFGMADDIRRSIEAGFDGHLTKPVSMDDLLQLIEELTATPPAAELEPAAGGNGHATAHPAGRQ